MIDDSWVTYKEAQTRLASAGCSTNISDGRIHFQRGSIGGSFHIHPKGVDDIALQRVEAKLYEDS